MFQIPDDSGFLAIVVPNTYSSFVDNDWEFDQLMNHFHQQMMTKSLLIWGTGSEGLWNVEVRKRKSSAQGFREVSGPIQVVGGEVLITNYENLTMAALFETVQLPQKHEIDQIESIANGDYVCRIVQMFDPEKQEAAVEGIADFVVEFFKAKTLIKPWSKVPWFSD